MVYIQLWSMMLTALWSCFDTRWRPRSLRFRFVVLEVRMWLLYALERLIFPVAVFLNLFFAALFVFIFGMRNASFS
jgi:hypothetical protein